MIDLNFGFSEMTSAERDLFLDIANHIHDDEYTKPETRLLAARQFSRLTVLFAVQFDAPTRTHTLLEAVHLEHALGDLPCLKRFLHDLARTLTDTAAQPEHLGQPVSFAWLMEKNALHEAEFRSVAAQFDGATEDDTVCEDSRAYSRLVSYTDGAESVSDNANGGAVFRIRRTFTATIGEKDRLGRTPFCISQTVTRTGLA